MRKANTAALRTRIKIYNSLDHKTTSSSATAAPQKHSIQFDSHKQK